MANVWTVHLFICYSVLCTDTLIHRLYVSLLRPGRWLIQAQVCRSGPACGRCFMKASCLIHSERGEGGRPLGGHTQGGQDRLLLSLTQAEGHLGPEQGQRDVFVRTPPPRSLPGYGRDSVLTTLGGNTSWVCDLAVTSRAVLIFTSTSFPFFRSTKVPGGGPEVLSRRLKLSSPFLYLLYRSFPARPLPYCLIRY